MNLVNPIFTWSIEQRVKGTPDAALGVLCIPQAPSPTEAFIFSCKIHNFGLLSVSVNRAKYLETCYDWLGTVDYDIGKYKLDKFHFLLTFIYY